MSITIEDIAKHLDISVSTVSKALNDYADVSARTKERVQQAARSLGYHPNTSARSLRRGRTDKIGLLINNPISYLGEYLSAMMTGAAITAERYDQNLMLYTKTVTEAEEVRRICRVREVDGLIVIFEPDADVLAIMAEEKMPFVVFGRRVNDAAVSFVTPDNEMGAYLLTQHLIQLGHRRIAFTPRPQLGVVNQDRYAGYQRALREAEIALEPDLIVETRIEPNSGYHAMMKLLDLSDPPSALFAFYDLLAVDAMRAAQERGLRVPDDIAIAGFDGLRSSFITSPAITTVRQRLTRMGSRAVELLLAHIDAPHTTPTREVFPVELAIRASTAGSAAT